MVNIEKVLSVAISTRPYETIRKMISKYLLLYNAFKIDVSIWRQSSIRNALWYVTGLNVINIIAKTCKNHIEFRDCMKICSIGLIFQFQQSISQHLLMHRSALHQSQSEELMIIAMSLQVTLITLCIHIKHIKKIVLI